VTTFCAENGIPRETFYAIKRRALEEGQAPVLEPLARGPQSCPNRTGDFEAQIAAKPGTVAADGIIQVRQTRSHVTWFLADERVYLVETDQHQPIFDDQDTELRRYRWPRSGIKYVGSGRLRGRQPRTRSLSAMS
jgi:hypothetical protein